MGRGVRDLGGGWMVSVIALDRRRSRVGGGAAPHVRRDDARAKPPRRDLSAQRLRDAPRLGLLDGSTVAIHRPRSAGPHAAHRAAGADAGERTPDRRRSRLTGDRSARAVTRPVWRLSRSRPNRAARGMDLWAALSP